MDGPEPGPQAEWADRVGTWDLRHFLVHNVSVGHASAVAAAMLPEFVEHDGCVFVEFLFDEKSYRRWRDKLGGDRRAIEEAVNHLHLWDMFTPSSEVDYAALNGLAHKMARSWRSAASEAFPDRRFRVDVAEPTDDYGPTITLYTTGD